MQLRSTWRHCAITAAVALAGAATMVLEIAGAHALAPGFGTGLNAWVAAITTGLGGLAVGYALGGRLAGRSTDRLTSVTLPAALLVGSAGFLVDALCWQRVVNSCAPLGPRAGALIAAGSLFLMPFVALGAVYPLALQAATSASTPAGRTGGFLSSASAAGALTGALLAGVVLVPNLPVGTIFSGCASALAGACLLALRIGRPARVTVCLAWLSLLLPGAVLYGRPSRGVRGEVYRRGSLFGPCQVIDRASRRFLVVSGTIQGGMDRGTGESVFPYVESIAKAIQREIYDPEPRILLLGLGAGMLPRLFEPGMCLTVEVDPAILSVAKRYFGFDDTKCPVVLADARHYLLSSGKQFDAIVLDAYGGGNYPYHLCTREFFALARDHLRPDGFLVLNFLGFVKGAEARAVRSLELTLQQVFPQVELSRSEVVADYANTGFVAHSREDSDLRIPLYDFPLSGRRPPRDGRRAQVLTDAMNPIELWGRPVEARWREESRLMLAAAGTPRRRQIDVDGDLGPDDD